MAGPTIGTIRGTIEIDYDGKGIVTATRDVTNLTDRSQTSADKLNKMSNQLLVFGGVVAGGLAVATKSAISFEKQLSAVQAVSGASASEMDQLSKKALQLGADTKFSAAEAGQAIEELVKAGLSVTDVLNGAADATVALAAAGEITLPEAATIAANAMNQFGLAAQDLPKVVDNIAGAANASAIDVSEFGFALAQVGAVAHLNGQTFEQTATAIALLGNAGIKGSDAGTSLKTLLSNLIPITKRETEAFMELGLVTKDGTNLFIDATGHIKDLSQIAQILQDKTMGLTEAQRSQALQTIFGSDAIRAAAILAEQGATGFNELSAAMNKTTAADVAATRMNNVAGQIEQLKGSLETAGIQVGGIFLPLLKEVTKQLTDLANAFSALGKGPQQIIVGFIAALGGLALAGAALVKLTIFFNNLAWAIGIIKQLTIWTKIWSAASKIAAAAQWLWNIAVAAFPVILIIVAIAAVIAAIILLWQHSEKFRDIVIGVWNAIKAAAQAVGKWFMATLWPLFKATWDLIVAIFKTAFAIILAVWAVFKTVWLDPIIWVLTQLWTFISWLFTTIINIIVSFFQWSAGFWKGAWNVLVAIVQFIWNLMWSIIKATVGFIIDLVKILVDTVVSIFDGIRVIVDKIGNFFGELKKAAEGGVGSLIAFVAGIPLRILNALGDIGAFLYNSGRKLIQGFIDGIKSMASHLMDVGKDLLGGLRKLWPFSPAKEGPFSGKGWVLYSGQAIMEDFAKGMTMSADVPMDAATAALSGTANAIPGGPGSSPSTVANTTTNNNGTTVGTVAINGVWDFTNPVAIREMLAKLHDMLARYEGEYV